MYHLMPKFDESANFDKKICRTYSRLAQSLICLVVLCLYRRFSPITQRFRHLTSFGIMGETQICPLLKTDLRLQAESSDRRLDSQRSGHDSASWKPNRQPLQIDAIDHYQAVEDSV